MLYKRLQGDPNQNTGTIRIPYTFQPKWGNYSTGIIPRARHHLPKWVACWARMALLLATFILLIIINHGVTPVQSAPLLGSPE